MTNGELQQEKLEALLHIMDSRISSFEDIRQLCSHQDKLPVVFMAIKRGNGDCVKITLNSQIQSTKWWVRCDGDKHLDKECTDINEVISHIEKISIPLKLVKS